MAENISSAIEISTYIEKHKLNVRKYITSYEEFTTENIEEKEIIVATNLAGRGTHLQISKNSL